MTLDPDTPSRAHQPAHGLWITRAEMVIPTDRAAPIRVAIAATLTPEASSPQVLTPILIGIAQRLNQYGRTVHGGIGITVGANADSLPPFRFRDKSFSIVLGKGTDIWARGGPRSGLFAAMAAREAAIEGRDHEIDEFATTWLGLSPSRPAQWREAVSTALLTDWAEALQRPSLAEDSVLRLLKIAALTEHRRQQPVWTRRSGGARTYLLDKPVSDGMVLADLVTDGSTPEKVVLRALRDDPRIAAVLARLHGDERTLAHIWAASGDTWRAAAVAAGLPADYGERVRRKLKRLGNQHTERAEAAGTRRIAR